ncbi:MAG: DUF167 domain-containing protein [archaeon]
MEKMKLRIKLHPNSSQEKISRINEMEYEVWIKEKPINNRANIALVKLLQKYFNKPVKINSGLNSKNKIVEIK